MPTISNYKGIIPAIAVPFRDDYGIDEEALHNFAIWVARQRRVVALMTNGHTGEVFSLRPHERAQVTRITANAVKGICPVISSVVCEGIDEAVDHALVAKEAGAMALDVMPPHHWLRFGFKRDYCFDYFSAIGEATGLDLIIHVYPAWTKSSFSSELLAELAQLPFVQAFKIGTREMNKYCNDLAAIRAVEPSKALLTCHDEYLLASMVQGVDGALVGFASLVPELIAQLFDAVDAGDLRAAEMVQRKINPLKDAVYGLGEPTSDAHARMKAAMVELGIIQNGTVRPPTHAPSAPERAFISAAIEKSGLNRHLAA